MSANNHKNLIVGKGLKISKKIVKCDTDKEGLSPIYLKVYLNNTEATKLIHSKIKVNPENWNRGYFVGKNANQLNEELSSKLQSIRNFYLKIPQKEFITANEFMVMYRSNSYGFSIDDLMQTIIDTSVNNNSKESTINKVKSDVKRIRTYFNNEDVTSLSDINQYHLEDWGKKAIRNGYKTTTVSQDLFKVIGAIKYLVNTGKIINHHHFGKLRLGKPVKKEQWFLTEAEINKLLSYYRFELEGTKSNNKVNIALRWFLGMFYTGCNFDDMKHSFNYNECRKDKFFFFKRKKTHVNCCVPVQENRIEILKLFDGSHFKDFNKQVELNYQLSKISKALKFKRNITSKIARISYGSIMTPKMGIDSVRLALGHKNRITTENYYNVPDVEIYVKSWEQKNIFTTL